MWEMKVLRHCGHSICDGVEKKGTKVNGGVRAFPRLGIVRFMVVRVKDEKQSVTKAKCIDRNGRDDEWLDSARDGSPVKIQGYKKKESVRGTCHSSKDLQCGIDPEKVQMRRNQLGGARLIERELPKCRNERRESATYEGSSTCFRQTRGTDGSCNDKWTF